MKKRTLALAMSCALSLSLLSACGGKEEPTPAPVPESPEQSEPAGPETEQPEAPETEQPEDETPEQPELPFDLSHVDVTLKSEGSTFVLTSSLPDTKLYFGSEDESVATVDENGTVTAVAPGKTNILVETEDGRSASCIVRCDWKTAVTEPLPSNPSAVTVDLKQFVADLADKHGENFAANADVVEFGMHNDLYPGISDINTNQLVIMQPMMGAVVCEIALAEVSDAADVEAVKAVFQSRIDAQVDGGAWYPESIEGWKNNSRIVTNGNYVMMIAWQFCDDAVSAFNGLF